MITFTARTRAARIHVRLSREEKRRWREVASALGMTLSAWLRSCLNNPKEKTMSEPLTEETEVKNDDVSYDGIDEAVLVHALYYGTIPLGMGHLHNKPGLSLEDVREHLKDPHYAEHGVHFDYFHGRPLKLRLDRDKKTFNPRLYDRNAGRGAAAAIVAQLKSEALCGGKQRLAASR